MDKKQQFLSITSQGGLARLFNIKLSSVTFFLFDFRFGYTSFPIPKKSGGTRTISAPSSQIKTLQYKLLPFLEACFIPHSHSYGFIEKKGIFKNADIHKNSHLVLNIDLKDFFATINFGRVRGLFMSKPFNFPPELATVIANIACNNNQLPQGGVTSPIISNMIARKLDNELHSLAKEKYCNYTRYVDDITFSTSRKSMPLIKSSDNGILLQKHLNSIIECKGFLLNDKNTRLENREMSK